MEHKEVFLTNDAVIFGILMILLALIFKTSALKTPFWKKFYTYIPVILLSYFLPSLLNTFGLVDAEASQLYFVASRFLLPACLVLLTLSIDLKEIFKLGPKALIMFFAATIGVIVGGPLAILIMSYISPDAVGGIGPDAVWRGMSTIAGSWIGGGANQAAMYEVFKPSDELYSVSITVDVIVAEIWMAILLLGIGRKEQINKFFKADNSSIATLRDKMEAYSLSIAKIPNVTDLMMILGIGFGITGLAHAGADWIAPAIANGMPELSKFSLDSKFFWIIVLATTFGIAVSFTKLREYEGAGASKIGTVFIFILVATIGMKMDVLAIFENPGFFAVGLIWMAFHAIIMIVAARLSHAPFFFLAVGSKANIGGAASAPVLAAAFHPSLAPVGVLLAVMGYALGTYGAWLCGLLMQIAAQN
ncbi:DUF819 domain-containing protein [Fulvivirga lutimaris]|uniref:DUF819 family protein n=1 Tax=Fulvivirga lutimaris TaxID=1819566 RepID=UPI0012BCB82F|nr:DUF819 family protein [Fulvivirga lutimaris]MTI39029.1 DUF819 family protein [Fulvivirga lutimaris]